MSAVTIRLARCTVREDHGNIKDVLCWGTLALEDGDAIPPILPCGHDSGTAQLRTVSGTYNGGAEALDEFTIRFLGDLVSQYEQKGWLTERQVAAVLKIEGRSDERRARMAERRFHVVGTVKSHDEYQGERQTVLARVSAERVV